MIELETLGVDPNGTRTMQDTQHREKNRTQPSPRCRASRALCWVVIAALLLPGASILVVPSGPAYAQDAASGKAAKKSRKKEKKKHKQFVVTPVVFKKLTEIQELLEQEQTAEALALLRKLEKRKLTEHETAIIYQTYGFAYSNQENYPKAAQSFEKSLATEALPDSTLNVLRYNLGQLYMAMEEFEKALAHLNRWMEDVENPGASAFYLIGIAHAQLDQNKKALPYIEKAVEKSKEFNESWNQLLLALYFEEKRYNEAVVVLDQLILHSPKEVYLQQLRGIYSELGKEEKALAVMELSYRLGYLDTDSELRNLARLYLFHEIPLFAANVLETGLAAGSIDADQEAWGLLADAWIFAREYERAIEPLRKAAEKSDDGELHLKLARVLMEDERWSDARSALEAALKKGDLKDSGNVHLMLGISNANTERYQTARSEFNRAAQSKGSAKSAQAWLQHLDEVEAEAQAQAAEEAEAALLESG